ncbi:MAG: thiamine pyrophosphate-binding protein [Dehalococcoidia bacterium]
MPLMSGKEALMETLISEKVEYVFGNPGSTEAVFMEGLYNRPEIQYILGLHETVAMGMAEGYAWASGKPGVVNVHALPGLANALSVLYNAQKADIGLVVTAGQQDTRLMQREPGLSGDLLQMARPFTKWSTEVYHAADIPLVMHRAFKVANQPPTGPVFVSLPQDVLEQREEVETTPPSHAYPPFSPDPEAIDRAAELLARAKRPALFVGFRLSRCDALKEAAQLAEMVGARVYENTVRPEAAFPTNHPLFVGGVSTDSSDAPDIFQDVDVILAVGANFVAQLFYLPKPLINPNTRVIHMDIDPWEIGKNQSTQVGIVGDIKEGLQALTEALRKRMSPEAKRVARARAKEIGEETKKRREVLWERAQHNWDRTPISDTRLMVELRECLEPGTIIVDGSVTASRALRDYFDFSEPKSYLSFRDDDGSLGDSLPMALGVKLAQPDRPVVGIVGDGTSLYSIQALWTAAHYDIPVPIIICSNATYRILKINAVRVMGQKVKDRLHSLDFFDPPIDFARLAQGFGIHGEQVRDPKDLRPALEKALHLGKPALVDVIIEGGI